MRGSDVVLCDPGTACAIVLPGRRLAVIRPPGAFRLPLVILPPIGRTFPATPATCRVSAT